MRLLPACLAAAVLGGAAAFGFAPFALWPLALACLAGLVALVERARGPGGAAAIGWSFGVGHFVVGLNWIATAFTFQAKMPAWLGWVAVVLLSLYLAVFPALATGAGWWLARRAGRPPGWFLAAAWIAGELLRAALFTGFPWNPVAAIWVPVGPVTLLARWTGTYGLSGLTLLLAAWLADAAQVAARWRAGLPAPRRGAGALVPVVAIVAAAVLVHDRAPPPPAAGPRLRVIQPGINQDEKWAEGAEQRNFARLAALTGPPGGAPRIVFWPEVAVPWILEEDAGARAALAALLGPRDLLLTGAFGVHRGADGRVDQAGNSLFAIDAAGRLLGRYDKAHLTPYGEYLPMRPLLSRLGLSRLAPGDTDFDPGPGPRDIVLPGVGPVGAQICYEMIFSGAVVDAGHRPRFLFNPSNDAWFGRWGPPQHLAQARLRAVEEGLPVVRSTPTGISAVVDADGRLLAALPWHAAGAIDARLPPALPPTLFARAGNALPAGLAGLLVAIGFASRRRRR